MYLDNWFKLHPSWHSTQKHKQGFIWSVTEMVNTHSTVAVLKSLKFTTSMCLDDTTRFIIKCLRQHFNMCG